MTLLFYIIKYYYSDKINLLYKIPKIIIEEEKEIEISSLYEINNNRIVTTDSSGLIIWNCENYSIFYRYKIIKAKGEYIYIRNLFQIKDKESLMINLNGSIIVFCMESFQVQTQITYNDISITNKIDDNRFAFIDNCQVGIFESKSFKIELIDYDLRLNALLTDDAFYDRGTNVHWTFLLTIDILLLGLTEG